MIRKDTRGEGWEGQEQHGWASGFDLKDVKVRNAAGTATTAESGHRNGNWLRVRREL